MPEKPLHPRVQFTRAALHRALADLILEKPLTSITVKDICARADINRSTFYLHYKDIYDLLTAFEDELLEHMQAQFPQTPTRIDDEDFLTRPLVAFLNQCRETPRMMQLLRRLFSEQGDPHFVHRLQKLTYSSFLRGWSINMPDASESRKLLIYSYIVPGIINLLSTWVSDTPDIPAEEVVAMLVLLVRHGADRLLPPQEQD